MKQMKAMTSLTFFRNYSLRERAQTTVPRPINKGMHLKSDNNNNNTATAKVEIPVSLPPHTQFFSDQYIVLSQGMILGNAA